MVFNSIVFAIFLVVVFTLYWGPLRRHLRAQNAMIVIASYIFYGWWDWRFLSLLFVSSAVDFIVALQLEKHTKGGVRKRWMAVSLVTNLGLLGVFKYYDFFISSWMDLTSSLGIESSMPLLNVILPVGISFYTFQTLSYTVDVYRRQLKATNDFICFSAFVSFFPQLVAGPIERASNLLPQFQRRRIFSEEQAYSGLRLMLWGFFKKIVIADNTGRYADIVFNDIGDYHGLTIVAGTVCFALQIYCDFSGYSDIARGCSRLLGFELMKNFDSPYFATDPRSFWRRWHISLSTWFRDYVYIPLGGNRAGIQRVIINLMITFVLSGLWHGANWTFVIWGTLHGMSLCIQQYSEYKKWKIRIPAVPSAFMMFIFTCFCWIFFRAENISDAWLAINNIFERMQPGEWHAVFSSKAANSELIQSLLLFVLLELLLRSRKLEHKFMSAPAWSRWLAYYGVIIWIFIYGALNAAPEFIYFQF